MEKMRLNLQYFASGTIDNFTKVKGTTSATLQGKIVWSSVSNGAIENTSTVTTKLYARRTDAYTSTPTSGKNWSGSVKVGNNDKHSFSTLSKNTSVASDWVLFKTYTDIVPHNDDGTCSVLISGSVTGATGTSLEGKTSTGSKTVTLDTIPRYATANVTLVRKTETGITIDWATDVPVDHIWYSVSDGSTWVDFGEAGGTDGSFTIGDLDPNTLYYVKVKVRRTDSQLESESPRLAVTTYDYPYCNGTPSFTIENPLTVNIENPLNRTCIVSLIGNDGSIYGEYETTGTSVTGFNETEAIEWLYSTIPNLKQGNYRVQVVHQGNVRIREGNTYLINTSKCFPVFTDYTYRDSNADVVAVTGNDQVLIKGRSNLEVTISSANKMVAKNGANPSKYNLVMDTLNTNVDYSDNDIVVNMGSLVNAGTKRLSVTAFDSRTLSNTVNKDVLVYDYKKPVVNLDVSRLNDFEAETTLEISGTYDKVNLDGVDRNSITAVQYRYKEVGSNEWSNWTTISTTLSNGNFTCNDVILSLDNTKAFNIEVQAIDKLDVGTDSDTVDVGEAIFLVSTNKKACYINRQKIIMYDVVEEW